MGQINQCQRRRELGLRPATPLANPPNPPIIGGEVHGIHIREIVYAIYTTNARKIFAATFLLLN